MNSDGLFEKEIHHLCRRLEGVFNWKYLVLIIFSIGNIFCQCGILSVTAATGWSHLKRLIERHKMADRYIQSISRILLDIFLISEENQISFATNGIMLQVIMTANLFIIQSFFEFAAIVAWLLPAIKRIGLLRADASQLAFKLGQLSPSWSAWSACVWLHLTFVQLWSNCPSQSPMNLRLFSSGLVIIFQFHLRLLAAQLKWEGSNYSLSLNNGHVQLEGNEEIDQEGDGK